VNHQALTDLQSGVLPPTGVGAGFMTHGSYFQSMSGGPTGTSLGTGGTGTGASFGTMGTSSGTTGHLLGRGGIAAPARR
jgi:hypothetical protein